MDWSTLLGALVGAIAAILGSSVTTWAQFRKGRLDYNRDKVMGVAYQFMSDCDKLLKAQGKLAVSTANCQNVNFLDCSVPPLVSANAGVAFETARTELAGLSFMCPKASKETKALFDAATSIKLRVINDTGGEDGSGHTLSRYRVDESVYRRYEEAKSDFIRRIGKLAGL